MRTALQILSPLPLTHRDDGRVILDLWKRYLPELLPDRYGNSEPVDQSFDPHNVEPVLDAWKWPLLTSNSTWSMESNIWMRKRSQCIHSTWILSFDSEAANQSDLLKFLKAASTTLEADLACLTLLTPTELDLGLASRAVLALDKRRTKFSFFISSKDLQNRVPDLFWVTVFGEPYVEMFGRERLLSAPAYETQLLTSGIVMLQLSEVLTDVENDPSKVNATRSRIKTHLGQDAFFQSNLPPQYKYRAPRFTFPDESLSAAN